MKNKVPSKLTFRFRTGEVKIDYAKCKKCRTYACVKADSLFGTSILRIQDKQPSLTLNREETEKRCNECLTCELYCQSYGNKGLRIELDPIASTLDSDKQARKEG